MNMTIKFRVAILLAFVAGISVLTGLYLFQTLSDAKNDATTIEALGRQRMLSQSIAKTVLNYAAAKQKTKNMENHILTLNDYISAMRAQYTASMVAAMKTGGVAFSMTPQTQQNPSVPFPATFTRMVNARAGVKGNVAATILSAFPVNPKSALQTPLDREAYAFLLKHKKALFFKQEDINNAMALTFYAADIATVQACADCHVALEGRPYKVGDLLGVRRYRVPFAPSMASGQRLLNPSLAEYKADKTIFAETLAAMKSGGMYPTDLARTHFRTMNAINDPKAQNLMDDVAGAFATVLKTSKKIISGTNTQSLSLKLGEEANKLGAISQALVMRFGEIAQGHQQRIRWVVAIAIILVLATSALVYGIFSRMILGRISVLSNLMETLADGDITTKVKYAEDRDEIGNMARAVQIFKDNMFRIERLRAERDEAQKLEAVGQLAGGIAHEINTPAQYIGDNLKFLAGAHEDVFKLIEKTAPLIEAARKRDDLSPMAQEIDVVREEIDFDYLREEIPSATEQSLSGIGDVSKIVQAMKEFSHPGSKEKSLTDINRALENTITISRNEWKHVAELKTDFDAALPAVPCLAGELNQVFLNLIVNAAHAIAAKAEISGMGHIKLSTRADKENVTILIEDDGTGISPNIQDKIFNPFFTTKEVGQGTGQGLAISHDIVVKKHGGKISFKTKPGEGTTFVIRLPIGVQETTGKALS